MGKIEIKDADGVMNDVKELYSKTDALEALKNRIEDNVITKTKDSNIWEQSQYDANAYNTALAEQINQLTSVVSCNNEFGSIVDYYAEEHKKTAANQVNG